MTLVELLVTLTIMGVMVGVTTLAFRRIEKPSPDDPYAVMADSMRAAVTGGRPVTLRFTMGGTSAAATVFPDGSILADSVLRIERLSGRAPHDR